jgi:hypothetical protein
MQTFQLKPSFAGGELTPALYGRTDLQKYDVGAAVLENAIVQRYGGVTRRPGFRHVAQTAENSKARLIPFSYNAEQNYVLEFTDQKVRVFANGEPLYIDNTLVEVTTPYTEAELPQIKYTQSADMLFLALSYRPVLFRVWHPCYFCYGFLVGVAYSSFEQRIFNQNVRNFLALF